jgi:hypothetical protein
MWVDRQEYLLKEDIDEPEFVLDDDQANEKDAAQHFCECLEGVVDGPVTQIIMYDRVARQFYGAEVRVNPVVEWVCPVNAECVVEGSDLVEMSGL